MKEKAATNKTRKRSPAHKLSKDKIRLFKAATDGDEATVRALLAKGVGVDIRDNLNSPLWDQTPLMYAAQNGHLPVVKVLLRAGADVSATDWSFATEDHRANQPLHYAASGGNVAIAEELISAGADVNALNSFGKSPLDIAIKNAHVPMVEALLARGAELNRKPRSRTWETALGAAAKSENLEVFQLLLARGADVNAVNELNQTPLILAARQPETIAIPMVEALLKAGVKVDHMDKDGHTALYRAVLNRNLRVARRLPEAGADINLIFKSQFINRGASGTLLDTVEAGLKANQKELDAVELRLKTRKRNFIRSAAELNRKETQEALAFCKEAVELLREFGGKRQKELK